MHSPIRRFSDYVYGHVFYTTWCHYSYSCINIETRVTDKNNINATTFQNHWNVGIGLPCNVARQMKQN